MVQSRIGVESDSRELEFSRIFFKDQLKNPRLRVGFLIFNAVCGAKELASLFHSSLNY
jgi:hypothetical protein